MAVDPQTQFSPIPDCPVAPHHRVVLGPLLTHSAFLEEAVAQLTEEIERRLVPFADAAALLTTIPGIEAVAAAAIVAEIGVDMGRGATTAACGNWGLGASWRWAAVARRRSPG